MSLISQVEGDLTEYFVTDSAIIDQYAKTGTLWSFGYNTNRQLGDNTTLSRSSPVQTVVGGTNWKFIANGGQFHTMALKTDGRLWGWGDNTYGQNGSGSILKQTPSEVVGYTSNWKTVSCGNYFSQGIKTDGTLWIWGRTAFDSTDTLTYTTTPTQLFSGTNWKEIACGAYNAGAIKTDGTLWTWGDNLYGQLGRNSATTIDLSPAQVGSGTNWKQISFGTSFAIGIKTDGTMWAWGLNSLFQLGLGTNTTISTPVQIGTGTTWKQVSCGIVHSGAIKTDGTLWMFGNGSNGALGAYLGTTPTQTYLGGTNWKQVACKSYTTAAIKTDGTLWTWGFNNVGQLGTGKTFDEYTPVQTIAGGNNWKQVSCGTYFTNAIHFYDSDNLYPSQNPPYKVLYTFSTNTENASLNISTISGYVAGKTEVTVYVNSGVYLWSSSTSIAGLTFTGATTGDTVVLINRGYIMGMGGNGGNLVSEGNFAGNNGGPAISLCCNTKIDNSGASAYIGGGGGGGGSSTSATGGGGAGGGNGGGLSGGGTGGSIGSSGTDGSPSRGGGGGRIFPGVGGAGGTTTAGDTNGKGGGAGGGGGAYGSIAGGTGGSGNSFGTSGVSPGPYVGGGGGGWGAVSGWSVGTSGSNPGLGGKAVALNGYTVIWHYGNTDRVYGSVT
jgi:alpha-tubulin suppressor-like RCC1 family protein